jgi:hypothetical protein
MNPPFKGMPNLKLKDPKIDQPLVRNQKSNGLFCQSLGYPLQIEDTITAIVKAHNNLKIANHIYQ